MLILSDESECFNVNVNDSRAISASIRAKVNMIDCGWVYLLYML